MNANFFRRFGLTVVALALVGLSACAGVPNPMSNEPTTPAQAAYKQFELNVDGGQVKKVRDGEFWVYTLTNFKTPQGTFFCTLSRPVESSSLMVTTKRQAMALTRTNSCEETTAQ